MPPDFSDPRNPVTMSDPATTTPAGAENGGKQDETAATGAASTPRRVDFDDVSFLDEPKHRIHFRQARALLKESKYEEAADMFGALLQAVYVVTGVVWYCDCMWASQPWCFVGVQLRG